jgi:death-on-curing family protein
MVLFESSDGVVTLPVEVDATNEEVWLSADRMSTLFDRDVSVIRRHIRNIFNEKELVEGTNVHFLHVAGADRPTAFYSLDVIISVGYRVKSRRGIEFRKWATSILRSYLMKGYVANEQRLRDLGQAVSIMARLPEGDLSVHQVLDIVQSYSRALDLLDDYDHQTVLRPDGSRGVHRLTYDECRKIIAHMRFGSESDLFGVEKDDSFKASIGDIYAGFAGEEAYPTVEEKAANLLYFVVKNHSFLDGNKRIAAAVFLYFLDRNGLLFDAEGNKRLADEVLVALTIMLAESRPQEKELMVSLVMNFLAT